MSGRTKVRGSGDDRKWTPGNGDRPQATCDPVLPDDLLEDGIADALLPERLSTAGMKRLAIFLSQRGDTDMVSAIAKQYQQAMARLIVLLEPPRSAIANWYALHFVIGSRSVQNMTAQDVANMLGISRANVARRVGRWRKELGMTLPQSSMRSNARHLIARRRRNKRR